MVDTYLHREGKLCFNSFGVNKFKVYKLKMEQNKWVEIKSLDDQILYFGKDCSFSVSAQDFCSCKGNCILYTYGTDLLVFNLDDGRISSIDKHPEYNSMFYPPSTWPSPGNHVEKQIGLA